MLQFFHWQSGDCENCIQFNARHLPKILLAALADTPLKRSNSVQEMKLLTGKALSKIPIQVPGRTKKKVPPGGGASALIAIMRNCLRQPLELLGGVLTQALGRRA